MKLTLRSLAAAGAVLVLMTGCSGDSGESASGDTPVASNDTAEGDSVLGAEDESLEALKVGTGATGGAWNGDQVTLEFAEGSKADPTATINCSAVNRLITEGQSALLAYPDGELDCEEVRRQREG